MSGPLMSGMRFDELVQVELRVGQDAPVRTTLAAFFLKNIGRIGAETRRDIRSTLASDETWRVDASADSPAWTLRRITSDDARSAA